MALNCDRIEIDKGIALNLIPTDKFKSNILSFYFTLPLDRREVTSNALLPLVLRQGTRELTTSLKIQRRLEDLYGCNLSVSVDKKGETHAIRFTIEGPKNSYIGDSNYIKGMIGLLKSIIYDPYLEDGTFSQRYIEQEKEILKRLIEGKINDKRRYAIYRCIEEMCRDEKFGLYPLGYIEDLEDIEARTLYEHYMKLLYRAPLEIFYVGDYDDELKQFMIDDLRFAKDDLIQNERELISKGSQTKNMVYEDMDINQGKLVIGYRTGIPYEDDLYNGLMVASDILGGGPTSKLFRNVREAESLAYYIGTSIYRYKSIMMIDAGIDFDDFERVIEIIRCQIDAMKSGIFTNEDIDISKKSIKASMESIHDSAFLISEYFFSKVLTNDSRSLEESIRDVEKVTRDEIMEASNDMNVDTIYFLRHSGDGGMDNGNY
ncbi:MAG: insulinase family protein [Tissierellia bacterium]|nr:insulinase family protein [Tissierellia bacterium]